MHDQTHTQYDNNNNNKRINNKIFFKKPGILHTVKTSSDDISMEFGQCAKATFRKRKLTNSECPGEYKYDDQRT